VGDRGALLVEHVGLEGGPDPLPVGGVVDEGRTADPAPADANGGLPLQAAPRLGAAAEPGLTGDPAGGRQHRRVGFEPEATLGLARLRGPDLDGLGEHHPEVGEVPLPRSRVPALAGLPREALLLVLPPAVRHGDVADAQRRIDAPGDAREQDAADIEVVEGRLGGHRGVHHRDAAGDEDHLVVPQPPEVELPAGDGPAPAQHRSLQQLVQLAPKADITSSLEVGAAGAGSAGLGLGLQASSRARRGTRHGRPTAVEGSMVAPGRGVDPAPSYARPPGALPALGEATCEGAAVESRLSPRRRSPPASSLP